MKGLTKILDVPSRACKEIFGVKRALIGFAGNADVWGEVVNYFHTLDTPPKCKGIEFLMLNNRKELYHGTNLRNWMLLPDKFFAIGSGMHYAMGAMSSGKTPIEACKIAAKHDTNTGMGFKYYEL